MEVKFLVTKDERKALITAISELTGCTPTYQGAPSFAFAVGSYIIDRYGTLVYDERINADEIRNLITSLAERGFVFEGGINEIATPTSDMAMPAVLEVANGKNERTPQRGDSFTEVIVVKTPDRLVLEVPLASFSHTALDNLEKLVAGKGALIMKAISADALPIERTDSTLCFPWFPFSTSTDVVDAYMRFVVALCELAKKQKRVTLKETLLDADSSEKFAFRCFLLRLGFKGDEYKNARRILLSKLSGNSSFKTGDHKRGSVPESVTAAVSGEINAETVNNP